MYAIRSYYGHPVLLRVYNDIHFQRLLAMVTAPVRANSEICNAPVLFTLAPNPIKDGEEELRLICSPLLVVSLWSDQNKPPPCTSLFNQKLTENELEKFIVSELIRLICFSAEPDLFLCENIRRLINKTISESVRSAMFGKKTLSQTDFGLLVGLTREQMAHGASDPRNKPTFTQKTEQISPMNINIFNQVCGHDE